MYNTRGPHTIQLVYEAVYQSVQFYKKIKSTAAVVVSAIFIFTKRPEVHTKDMRRVLLLYGYERYRFHWHTLQAILVAQAAVLLVPHRSEVCG